GGGVVWCEMTFAILYFPTPRDSIYLIKFRWSVSGNGSERTERSGVNENLLRSETKSSAAIYYAKRLPLRSRNAAECGDSILATAYPYARSAAAKRRGGVVIHFA
ncbi:MAG: hypothetical protein LBH47_03150, partial [Christensenellaceae bacterium]|nr:hypothetical protein [Christensenellaceae bacterium]